MNALAPWWQIAGLGRHPRTHHFWKRVAKTRDPQACWEWTGARTACGYGILRWQGRVTYAHRLAYHYTRGPIPPGLVVRHNCDNPACCRPSHLRLGRHADNMHDMAQRGRARPHKLSAPVAAAIRTRAAAGESTTQLAAAYRVSVTSILQILRGRAYAPEAA